MEQTEFLRTVSTALCLIRDGCNSKSRLGELLGLSPIALADLIEEMDTQGYILHWSDHIVVSNAGRRAVSHIQLVENAGTHQTFTRRAAPDPAGRSRVA